MLRLTLAAIGLLAAGPALAAPAAAVLHPEKIAAGEMPDAIFQGPRVKLEPGDDGKPTKNVESLISADHKFMSGVYTVDRKHSFETGAKGYPDNEFMYFVKGGIKLTSIDGVVTEAHAGDAVSIPKGWQGKWESDGYTKYYVVYDPAGPVD